MKVHLMFRDRDFDLTAELPPEADALGQDLGLEILFAVMARGDRFLYEVAKKGLFASVDDVDAIRYRQAILADCLARPDAIRAVYGLAVETIDAERKVWGYTSRYADSTLRRAVDVLGIVVPALKRLRTAAAAERGEVRSEGFGRLFDEIAVELGDEYLSMVEAHLRQLQFRDGVTLGAQLGAGNRGTNYILRRRVRRRTWRERIGLAEPDTYTWHLPERDEAGADALRDLRGQGIALAADAMARSTDHILSYFTQLRSELGFYVACLNLRDALAAKGEPICLPTPRGQDGPALSARGLYDVALSLSMAEPAVGSDLAADGKNLLVVTGANRGGKSTFLRSLGLAQLMMQAGMFVGAESLEADIRDRVFTHFRREEDATLQSGKLDEELRRMSALIDRVTPGSLVLLNESFASTNEREGSEIGRQIVHGLLEAGVKVGYVSHMFDLADGFQRERRPDGLFLRAERLPDGQRTFRIVEGEPLPTSHGVDIYRRVFGTDPLVEASTTSAAAS
jgi:DNA mismatch repair ATPase MutS